MSKAFKMVGQGLSRPVSKAAVFVLTLAMLGCGGWGLTLLETRFESVWFLPQESYLRQWFNARCAN